MTYDYFKLKILNACILELINVIYVTNKGITTLYS